MRRRRRGLVNFVTDIHPDIQTNTVQSENREHPQPTRGAPRWPRLRRGGVWFNRNCIHYINIRPRTPTMLSLVYLAYPGNISQT